MNAAGTLERTASLAQTSPNPINNVAGSTSPYSAWTPPLNQGPQSTSSSRRVTSGTLHRPREHNGDWRRGRGAGYRSMPRPSRASCAQPPSSQPPPPPFNDTSQQKNVVYSTPTTETPRAEQLFVGSSSRFHGSKEDEGTSQDVFPSEEDRESNATEEGHSSLPRTPEVHENMEKETSPSLRGRSHTAAHWYPSEETLGEGQHQHSHRGSGSREFPPALQVTIQKTRLCVHLTRGRQCPKHNCMFAHSTTELRQRPNLFRTKLCRSFSDTGTCDNGRVCKVGESCRFAHGPHELRPSPSAYGIRSWGANSTAMINEHPTQKRRQLYHNEGSYIEDEKGQESRWEDQRETMDVGDLKCSSENGTKAKGQLEERIILRVIEGDRGVPHRDADHSKNTFLTKFSDETPVSMIQQQTTTATCSIVDSVPSDHGGKNYEKGSIGGQEIASTVKRCPPPPPSSPSVSPDLEMNKSAALSLSHPHARNFGTTAFPTYRQSPYRHGDVLHQQESNSTLYPRQNAVNVAVPPVSSFGCNIDGGRFVVAGAPPSFTPRPLHRQICEASMNCSLLPLGNHTKSRDRSGAVIPELRRYRTMDPPSSKSPPYNSSLSFSNFCQKQLTFWPGSIERPCDSPTPSTHSSPAVVFRASGTVPSDPCPTTTTAAVVLSHHPNQGLEESKSSPDWLTQISHFKPTLAVTRKT